MTAPSQHAAFEARQTERAALQSQVIKLEAALAEALAARDRAIARKAVNGSSEARTAAEAAVGAVVRAEAELAATRSALDRLTAQAAENTTLADQNREAAKVKAAADAAVAMLDLAGQADAALAAFATAHNALAERLAALHGLVPPELKDPVFGGGHGLSQALLATAARNQLSAFAIVPRQAFPNPITETLASAVAHFTKPLIDAAAVRQPVKVNWD